MARTREQEARSIRILLTEEEMSEVRMYTDRHGGKKGTVARAALLDKARADNAKYKQASA